MPRQFTVIIERRGLEYVARCPELADVIAHGSSKEEALESIREVVRKKFGGSTPPSSDEHPA